MCDALGIDVGSTTCKAVAIDAQGVILAFRVEPSDPRVEHQARTLLDALRDECDAAPDVPVGATGFGRKRVGAARVLTEITCHARGAYQRTRHAGVLVDIGGQDTKVIQIDETGHVVEFAMNDKCAAGTGRFLEVILARLRVSFDEVQAVAHEAQRAAPISSTCTVFAESEVVSLIADGVAVPDIVRGLHHALSMRVVALGGRMPTTSLPLLMSGGVARNAAMVTALGETFGRPLAVLPEPQLIGALGAALSVLPR